MHPDDERTAPARPAPTWRAIETIPVFLLSLAITLVIGYVMVAVTAAVLGWPIARILDPAKTDSAACSASSVLSVFATELGFLGAVLLWVRLVRKAPLTALGPPSQPLRDVAIGLGSGVLIVLAGGIALVITTAIATAILGHPPEQPTQVATCVKTASALAIMGVGVVLAAPVAEESFFRGFLYSGLRRRFSVWPAAVVSGIVFGLVHISGLAFLLIVPPLVLVGTGLAFVYERRGSLLASITAHATFNLVGFGMIVLDRIRS